MIPGVKTVILCGGKGTRLGLTDRPKPMVEVAGKPLLQHILENAIKSGCDDFIFLTGHMSEVIEDYFGNGSRWGVRIQYLRETEPLGTAGAMVPLRTMVGDELIVLYGDILLDVDLRHMLMAHWDNDSDITVLAHPNDHPYDSDLIEVHPTSPYVKRFIPKPHDLDLYPNLVSAAVYIMETEVLWALDEGKFADWGRDIFPMLVERNFNIMPYKSLEYAKDMGTPDRVLKGEAAIRSGKLERLSRRNPKPVVFVDRDGVLNEELNGVYRPQDLRILPGVGKSIKKLNDAGIPVICVTNQPGLAKGFMSPAELAAVHMSLDVQLAEFGAYVDDLYYCPHHPEAGHPGEVAELKVDCECRKPRPGMLLQAQKDHNIDLEHSWMVGDRHVDITAAHAAKAKGILVQSGHAGSDIMQSIPDMTARDFNQAVDFILEHFNDYLSDSSQG